MTARPNVLKLKPLARQVVVITGATSGVGLSTARAATARGARVVLAARSEDALKAVEADLKAKGADVVHVVADVGQEGDVRRIAETAVAAFGGFDTWINNAGVSIVGPLSETSIDDHRRLFDTNYWGVVNGSLVAVEHFRSREGGGALINIGSTLGDLAVPLQGAQAAAKHAVRAFTNALRMELAEERAPVSVTLIKPSAVDTPLDSHARNLTSRSPRHPPPVYATSLVVRAILHAAEHRARELTIGAGGRALVVLDALAPALVEAWLAVAASGLHADAPAKPRSGLGNLHRSGEGVRERTFRAGVRETSLYSEAEMRPKATLTLALLAGLGVVTAIWLGVRQPKRAEVESGRFQSLLGRLGLNGAGARPVP